MIFTFRLSKPHPSTLGMKYALGILLVMTQSAVTGLFLPDADALTVITASPA